MKVLILGSGGREHALGWAFAESGHEVYFLPGNGGTEITGINLYCDDIMQFVKERGGEFDLIIPGPESYIAKGVADLIKDSVVFAPSFDAARLEASKVYAKRFMEKYGIPTANFEVAQSPDQLKEALSKFDPPYVLKADVLAGGKGVFIVDNKDEALSTGIKLMKGELLPGVSGALVVDQFLKGKELSAIYVVGESGDFKLLPFARDYKRVYDGDRGPNTGGMGCWAPVNIDNELIDSINDIAQKTIYGIKQEDMSYKGFLYIGLMLTDDGPYVLEYNVRMGDPETEAILPLDPKGFVDVVLEAAFSGIPKGNITTDMFAVDVVVASCGYPLSPKKGQKVVIDDIDKHLYFFAGVKKGEDGNLYVSGGRVVNAIGTGKTLKEARLKAYEAAEAVKFEGAFYRKDIAL